MADPIIDDEDISAAGKLTVDLLQMVDEETQAHGMIIRGYLTASFKAAYDVLMKELPVAPQVLVNALAAEVVKHVIRMEPPKEKQ